MRRKDHERIVHGKDREINFLREQNRDLLDKLLYVTGHTWTPPPPMAEVPEEPGPDYQWAPEQNLDSTEPEFDPPAPYVTQ